MKRSRRGGRRWFRTGLLLMPALALLGACRTVPVPVQFGDDEAPVIRFLLTFDDGPSIREDFNPTLAILDHLENNELQPSISALFFVQTHHPRAGGTPYGRTIMGWMHEKGHVIGLHSISPEGHIAHHTLDDDELIMRLADAKALIRSITGSDPLFVRPPYGAHTHRTQAIYEMKDIKMVMCDIRAKDGIIYGYTGNPRRRSYFRRRLTRLAQQLRDDKPANHPHPVLITFHDLNPTTGRLMTDYLHILVEEARRVGLRVAEKPFYDTPEEVVEAVRLRRIPLPVQADGKKQVSECCQ